MLALAEEADRGLHLLFREAQVLHHTACRLNLALRNASVSLRDATHDGEGAAKEDRADERGSPSPSCAFIVLGVAIVLMTEQHADQRPDRPRSDDRADEPADDFSFPLHEDFLTVT